MPSRPTRKEAPSRSSKPSEPRGERSDRSSRPGSGTRSTPTPIPTPVRREPAPPPEPREVVNLIEPKPVRREPVVLAPDAPPPPTRSILPSISRIRGGNTGPVEAYRPLNRPVAKPVEPEPVPEPAPAATEIPILDQDDVPEDKLVHLKPPIIVRDLADALQLKPFQIIHDLMELGIFAAINHKIEPDVTAKICAKHGFVFAVERREKGGGVHKEEVKVVQPPKPVFKESEELVARPPIVTFMGHVDHGKTSLLDAIRKTSVVTGEAGGITQHIGAYMVEDEKGHKITFLDTPGHEAFSAMRARGANVTDIVVLVVAADDGLMPQTIEAINHAKAAGVAIIVAINKIDLPGSNPDRVKAQLQEHDLVPEEWGGETIVVEVSATKGLNLERLKEMIALQAEILELQTTETGLPRGHVVEAQLDPTRGPTATVIITHGILRIGQPFICGKQWGKVKALIDYRGKAMKEAHPSTPAKILGFTGVPNAGDEFVGMETEKDARTLSEERFMEDRTTKLASPQRARLEDLLAGANTFEKKHLRVVLKGDVQGSLEALAASLAQIKSEKIDLNIIHMAAGPISESDVLLASASDAVILGFNVKVENTAVARSKSEGVQIKLFSIIYELLDQVKEAMTGMLDPELRETVIGHAIVKMVFDLSRGIVAGCQVEDGRILRIGRARVIRKKQAVFDGNISTLRRFKDDVKEVRVGLECGIRLGDYTEYEEGDIIECYQLDKVAQTL